MHVSNQADNLFLQLSDTQQCVQLVEVSNNLDPQCGCNNDSTMQQFCWTVPYVNTQSDDNTIDWIHAYHQSTQNINDVLKQYTDVAIE